MAKWQEWITRAPDKQRMAEQLMVVLIRLMQAGALTEAQRVASLVLAALDDLAALERALHGAGLGEKAQKILAGVGKNPTAIAKTLATPKVTGVRPGRDRGKT